MSPTIKRVLGIVMILCAIFILGTAMLYGPQMNLITGIIILVFGIRYVASPGQKS